MALNNFLLCETGNINWTDGIAYDRTAYQFSVLFLTSKLELLQ